MTIEKDRRDGDPDGLKELHAPMPLNNSKGEIEDQSECLNKLAKNRESFAISRAREASYRAGIKKRDADLVSAKAAALSELCGGLPMEHGGREIRAEKRRIARRSKSRPGQARASARYRSRLRDEKAAEAAEAIALVADLATPSVEINRAVLHAELRALIDWLKIRAPRQRKLQLQRVALWNSRVILLKMRGEIATGVDPGPTEFARRLTDAGMTTDRRRAHKRLQLFQAMEASGGPWAAS